VAAADRGEGPYGSLIQQNQWAGCISFKPVMESFLESATWVVVAGAILWFVLLVYCLWDILTSSLPAFTKVLWVAVIFLAPFLGCIVYLLLRRHRAS
jgi:hypothetical protein